MKQRAIFLSVFFLIVSILTACMVGSSDTPISETLPIADLTITNKVEISIPDARSISLSQDGQWLAIDLGQELCVYSAATLSEERCVSLENDLIQKYSTSWSPDSSMIAFLDDYSLDEQNDIWIFHTLTGELQNLTQNQLRYGFVFWSPRSDKIIFMRVTDGDAGIFTIAIENGGLERINFGGIFYDSLVWQQDERIFFTSLNRWGVWLLDLEGDSRDLIAQPDPEMRSPRLMDISVKGDKALIIYYLVGISDFFSKPNISYCAVVDLDTGGVKPLMTASGNEVEFYGPTDATFSPDGSKVLYTFRDTTRHHKLVVRDLAMGEEKIFILDEDQGSLFMNPGHVLTWSDNDLVFLPIGSVLLNIGYE